MAPVPLELLIKAGETVIVEVEMKLSMVVIIGLLLYMTRKAWNASNWREVTSMNPRAWDFFPGKWSHWQRPRNEEELTSLAAAMAAEQVNTGTEQMNFEDMEMNQKGTSGNEQRTGEGGRPEGPAHKPTNDTSGSKGSEENTENGD